MNHNRNTLVLLMCGASLMVLCACGTSGSWRLARTDPPGVGFPLEHIELDDTGRFRATTIAFGERIHTQGRYRWWGRKLIITGPNGKPQAFAVHRRRDGGIEFVQRVDGARVSAIFEPVEVVADQEVRATVDENDGEATGKPPDEHTGVPDQ